MLEIYNDNTLDLSKLKRTPEKQTEYDEFLSFISDAGSTPEEAVLQSLDDSLVKVINPFRYELDDSLEHYLIWTTNPKNTYALDTLNTLGIFRFQLGVKKIFFNKHNLVAIFINSPEKKSVNLQHWHVIVRK